MSQVLVRFNNLEQGLKALRKKLQREGVFRKWKLLTAFEKPSEKRARLLDESIRRRRKSDRRRVM